MSQMFKRNTLFISYDDRVQAERIQIFEKTTWKNPIYFLKIKRLKLSLAITSQHHITATYKETFLLHF